MKLFPTDEDFILYESGFDPNDQFGRAAVGAKLSALVDNVKEPLVVALDGAWGTGKTYFLKRWVGTHEGGATTVYFDAFASDFHDSPLLALMVELEERIGAAKKSKPWKKLLSLAPGIARPAARIGLNAMTAGMAAEMGVAAVAGIEAARKEGESAIDALWREERGILNSIDSFKVQQLRNEELDVAVLKEFFGIDETVLDLSTNVGDRATLHDYLAVMAGAYNEFPEGTGGQFFTENSYGGTKDNSDRDSRQIRERFFAILEDFKLPPITAP